jgi:1-deoxy-D-xylulose-5-phosphate synthase
MGGAGSAVMEALHEAGFTLPVLSLGLADEFSEHGDPAKLLSMMGLDAAGIERSVRERFIPDNRSGRLNAA